ncbi:MAG: GGDEF domain-containing protein [Alphaproteobacteria bacterium]|nr:GGDEF domain-containing protein [Alphaproteobacteria bacterium]
MVLDPPTLIVSAGMSAGVLFVVLVVSWLQDRTTTALLWWSAALAIAASGLVLYTSAARASDPAREFGNAMFLLASGCVYAGACRFNRRPISPAIMLAAPIAWLAAVWTVEMSFAARVSYGSILFAALAIASAWEFWRGDRLIFQRGAAVIMSMQATFFLARIASGPAIFMEGGGESLDNNWATVMGVSSLLYVNVIGYFMLGMAKERADIANRRAALSDPLTGVGNRRGFLAAGERLLAQAKGAPVTLLLFDLDHFKAVNDRHGHSIGDDVLVGFCDVLRAELPASAVIGRMGGEEFAVTIVGAEAGRALDIAESVRTRFARDWGVRDGLAIEATVSAGIAADPIGVTGLVTLLSRADSALYRAKAAGRDRIETAAASPVPA